MNENILCFVQKAFTQIFNKISNNHDPILAISNFFSNNIACHRIFIYFCRLLFTFACFCRSNSDDDKEKDANTHTHFISTC